jgi:hypothetical protein
MLNPDSPANFHSIEKFIQLFGKLSPIGNIHRQESASSQVAHNASSATNTTATVAASCFELHERTQSSPRPGLPPPHDRHQAERQMGDNG